MESSEGAKGELPNQRPSLENKELSIKAAELAKTTREHGMGILHGYFFDKSGKTNSYETRGYFIQGEGVRDGSYMYSVQTNGLLIHNSLSTDYFNSSSNVDAWVRSHYRPHGNNSKECGCKSSTV